MIKFFTQSFHSKEFSLKGDSSRNRTANQGWNLRWTLSALRLVLPACLDQDHPWSSKILSWSCSFRWNSGTTTARFEVMIRSFPSFVIQRYEGVVAGVLHKETYIGEKHKQSMPLSMTLSWIGTTWTLSQIARPVFNIQILRLSSAQIMFCSLSICDEDRWILSFF
jgi:hypothetical protein